MYYEIPSCCLLILLATCRKGYFKLLFPRKHVVFYLLKWYSDDCMSQLTFFLQFVIIIVLSTYFFSNLELLGKEAVQSHPGRDLSVYVGCWRSDGTWCWWCTPGLWCAAVSLCWLTAMYWFLHSTTMVVWSSGNLTMLLFSFANTSSTASTYGNYVGVFTS